MKLGSEHYVFRDWRVAFRSNLPQATELEGQAMVFTARRRSLYVEGSALAVMLAMLAAVVIYSGILKADDEAVFGIICILALAALLFFGYLLVMADKCFASLCIYANGVEWRSPLRHERHFFHQLDGLCISKTKGYTGRPGINQYEFFKGHKAVIKLSMDVYPGIAFMEQVFTTQHPCVAHVQTDRQGEAD